MPGKSDLDFFLVLDALAANDRDTAHRVYEHYVESGGYDLDPEFLASFAREQVAQLTA